MKTNRKHSVKPLMPSFKPITSQLACAVSLVALLSAFPVNSLAGLNTWENSAGNYSWDTTSQNWLSPAAWFQGDDALFGDAGVGSVVLNAQILAGNLKFITGPYTIIGKSGNSLTLSNDAPTLIANGPVIIAASLQGNAGLNLEGTGTLTLLGDTNSGVANQYTGGTFIHSGTVVLQCAAANATGSGYAIDSIEALDPAATVRIGSTFNGSVWSSQRDQLAAGATAFVPHLKMSGGTFDLYNDPKSQRIPCPEGYGTILNTGSNAQSGLIIVMDGQDHTFSGVIADGGPITASPSGQGPGYQIGIVNLASGLGGEWTLAGLNTYSGSTRLSAGSIKLAGAGTLGSPSLIPGVTGPLRVYGPYHLDLNGTSQTIGVMTDGNSGGAIYNSAPGTVSTLNFGYGPNTNACSYQFLDNPGMGGILALTKVGTGQQGLNGVCTYRGDTTVSNGVLVLGSVSAVSPNTRFRLFTTGGMLRLEYAGDAPVRGLYLNGVRQPPGTYSSANAPIAGPGTITVPLPNLWLNGTGDSIWNLTSADWNSPTDWINNDDAIFGSTGAGIFGLGDFIRAHSLTFNAPGYTLLGNGYALTLTDPNPTITANQDVTLAASLQGTNGIVFAGNATTTLQGDVAIGIGNQFTGGAYVKSGKVVLAGSAVNVSGAIYAVDAISGIDPGAIVQIGTQNDGSLNTPPPDGQIKRINGYGRLNLTGGTFDNNGDNNALNYPPPSGTGIILNSSPFTRAVLKLIATDNATYVFNGQIRDGGPTVVTPQGTAFQENVDMNTGSYTLVLGGSNSFTGFLRLNSVTHRIVLQPGGTLGYATPVNCPPRQILMNNGVIDLNGTSQKVGYVYTGNNNQSAITNSAAGTISTLTVGFNCTNSVAFNGASTPRGLRCGLMDDPTRGGTLALTKEGICIQPIGDYPGDGGIAAASNYHGDTLVNNGILEVCSSNAVSPNSAFRINTAAGRLQLDYTGTASVRQLWLNGIQQTNGVYGAGNTSAITGSGTLTVTGAVLNSPPVLGVIRSGGGASLTFSWSGSFKLQAKTNTLSGAWFDYPGGATSPVVVSINHSHQDVFFRLSN